MSRVALPVRLMTWSAVIAAAFAGILLARTFLFEPFEVPSGSMMPTLRIGDVVWVDKRAYRSTLFASSPDLLPARSEIVVFRHPQTDEYFVKRVIALPGERVMVLGHRVWVDGKLLEVLDPKPDDREMAFWSPQWRETTEIRWVQAGPARYRNLWSKDEKSWALSGLWTVPSGHVFVMGDWRDESNDSRAWGPVPQSKMVGRLACVWDGGARAGLQAISQRTRCQPDGPITGDR